MAIIVTRYHGVHQGGTKDYTLTRFENDKGVSLLVKRFGKVSTTGQTKVEKVTMSRTNALDRALDERRAKGYNMLLEFSIEHPTLDEAIKKNIPPAHQGKLYVNELAKLAPEEFDADSRETYNSMMADRKKMASEMMKEAREDTKKAEEAALVELKSHPMFGMF